MKNILKIRVDKNLIYMLLFICLMSFASCNNETYLEKAIKSDALICPLIHTENSEIILICVLAENLITELNKNFHIENVEDFIAKSINEGISIPVSPPFYEDYSYNRIKANSLIDSLYRNEGIPGILNGYFKKGGINNGLYILWNKREMFPVKETKPYPSFGEENNTDYIIYLFSKHNIFFNLDFIEHILMISISSSVSDMSDIH